MITPAPVLSRDDLITELQRFHASQADGKRAHRTFNTAFHGRGAKDLIAPRIDGEEIVFDVLPVSCELELREKLAQAEAEERAVALLVDFAERLPLDVQGRLAGGAVQRISRERRLGNLFGVARVDAALLESPLADALLKDGRTFAPLKSATTVSLAAAWRRFFDRCAGLSHELELSEEQVVSFFATQPSNSIDDLHAKMLNDPQEGMKLENAVGMFWVEHVGPVAALAWRQWRAGNGVQVAAMTFVLDGLVPKIEHDAVRIFLEMRLKDFGVALKDTRLLSRWAGLASLLDLRLKSRPQDESQPKSKDFLRDILKLADELAGQSIAGYLNDSRFLSAGFQGIKAALAQSLSSAVAAVGAKGQGLVKAGDVKTAVEIYNRLKGHRLFSDSTQEAQMNRVRMAMRLLAYLAQRVDWDEALRTEPTGELIFRLASRYAEEGGFVDFARRLVRGGHEGDPLDAATAKVAAAADRQRDRMDELFALALPRWNEERRLGRLLPIEKALDELGVAFVQGGEHRRLLILVMDGMSWSTAVELLTDLAKAHFGPLRWRPDKARWDGLLAPMIAAFPTVTSVSRSALFAGKLLRSGESLDTSKDPERLLAHKGFTALLREGPRLLLRRDAEDEAGHLTSQARDLIRKPDRVVSLVVNAIDDQLIGKPGYEVRYNQATIKALQPILELAQSERRAILLIADHGHVQASRPHTGIEATGADSPRYREVDEGAQALPAEVVLNAPNAYTTRASRRVAMLFDETARYKKQKNLGEHGGASLAEVVTPALLIGSEDLQSSSPADDGLDVVSYPLPAWWNLELTTPAEVAALPLPEPIKPKSRLRDVVSPDQGSLFPSLAPPAPTAVVSKASLWAERLTAFFAKDEAPRKAVLRDRVLPAVELLVAHNGQLSEAVFAGQLGEAPRNIGGRVAIVAEFLNEDGYAVIQHDVAGKQVRLDLVLLKELFGG